MRAMPSNCFSSSIVFLDDDLVRVRFRPIHVRICDSREGQSRHQTWGAAQ
jgi:hypothetical protein